MLLFISILAFTAGLHCEILTEVEGYGPEGPVPENEDMSPTDGRIPVEVHVTYEGQTSPWGYQGLYPPLSYGLGYQFPSYYPGLFAKYQRLDYMRH